MSETTHEHSHDEIHVPGPSWWPLILSAGLLIIALGAANTHLEELLAKYGVNAAAILSQYGPSIFKYITWGVLGLGGVVWVVGLGGWAISNIRERAHGPSITPAIAAKMGMWMFIGSEVIFFTGLITSFLLMRARSPVEAVDPLVASIPLVSLNTFILLTSSLTVVLAHNAIVTGNKRQLPLWLLLTIVFGSTFVGLQGVEYSTLYGEGLSWTGNALGTSFYTLTGTHGLHVIIGLVWCLIVLIRALQGGFNEKEYGGLEIFGLYWHFVDIVWILLFAIVYLIH